MKSRRHRAIAKAQNRMPRTPEINTRHSTIREKAKVTGEMIGKVMKSMVKQPL